MKGITPLLPDGRAPRLRHRPEIASTGEEQNSITEARRLSLIAFPFASRLAVNPHHTIRGPGEKGLDKIKRCFGGNRVIASNVTAP
jgi:hypothetical protein